MMWDGCLRFSGNLRPVVKTVEFEVEKCEGQNFSFGPETNCNRCSKQ